MKAFHNDQSDTNDATVIVSRCPINFSSWDGLKYCFDVKFFRGIRFSWDLRYGPLPVSRLLENFKKLVSTRNPRWRCELTYKTAHRFQPKSRGLIVQNLSCIH